MGENPGSLILDSAETNVGAATKINEWLVQVPQRKKANMVRNLIEFWQKRKAECNKLELKKKENYFTATLWKIDSEYVTETLSHDSWIWREGNLPIWQDRQAWRE